MELKLHMSKKMHVPWLGKKGTTAGHSGATVRSTWVVARRSQERSLPRCQCCRRGATVPGIPHMSESESESDDDDDDDDDQDSGLQTASLTAVTAVACALTTLLLRAPSR